MTSHLYQLFNKLKEICSISNEYERKWGHLRQIPAITDNWRDWGVGDKMIVIGRGVGAGAWGRGGGDKMTGR